jgi:hypothetical protein
MQSIQILLEDEVHLPKFGGNWRLIIIGVKIDLIVTFMLVYSEQILIFGTTNLTMGHAIA